MNNNTLKIMFSKKSDHWATPSKMYNEYMKNGFFDPCPLNSPTDNLFNIYNVKKMFINPPYSNINTWVDFAITHIKLGVYVEMLIPSRTDTKYFHKALEYFDPYFIKGRLKFNDSKNSAPFPSVILKSKVNKNEI